jgi:hypothetical protein
MYRFSIPHREKHNGNDNKSRYTRIPLNKCWPVSVHDGDAAKMSHVNSKWCEEKSEALRKYDVCV